MTMKNQNFELKRGDFKVLSITITRALTQKPVNLTNFNVRWTMYRDYGQKLSPIVTKNVNEGVTIKDAMNGVVEITIETGDTKNQPIGNYYYEVQLINDNDQQSTVTTGTIFMVDKL